MARVSDKLTDKAARSKVRDKPFKLSDGGGLFLLVQPDNHRYWWLAYRFNGKQELLALGVYPEVSLADARQKKNAARILLAEGKDRILFLVNKINIIDKHRLLIPLVENKTIRCEEFSLLIKAPSFPVRGYFTAGGNDIDMTWWSEPKFIRSNLGKRSSSGPPNKFKKIIDMPINVLFSVGELGYSDCAIRTLNAMRDEVDRALFDLAPFSPYF